MHTFMKLWFFKLYNYKICLSLAKTDLCHSDYANANVWILYRCWTLEVKCASEIHSIFHIVLPNVFNHHWTFTFLLNSYQKKKMKKTGGVVTWDLVFSVLSVFLSPSVFPLSNLPTLILTVQLESLKTIILQYFPNRCISVMLFSNI